MALPRYVAGTVPGQLDVSQPSRVLMSPHSTLTFAEFAGPELPPLAQAQLDALFATLQTRRIVIDVAPSGVTWRHIPPATFNGTADEGTWPRLVNCWGAEVVNMTRDQWDIHKLDPAFTCIVDKDMAHLYPAGAVPPSILGTAPTQAPISPPATDSDARQQPKAGSSAQPFVVDDSDRPSAGPSTAHRSEPHPERATRPNPYAARVETEAESDEEDEDRDEPAPPPPPPAEPATSAPSSSAGMPPGAAHATQAPPRNGKRKASASPVKDDMYRARSPSIIVLSSDDNSGAETEIGSRSRPQRDEPQKLPPLYRRAIFDPLGGSSSSSFPNRFATPGDNGYKRRRVDTADAEWSLPPLRNVFSDIPVHEWTVPPTVGSSPKRPAPSAAHTGPSFSQWRNPTKATLSPKPRYKFNLRSRATPSEQADEHTSQPAPAPQPEASTSKRRATESPDVEEIPDPGPSSKAKRQRTDEPPVPQTPRSSARRERAERRAAREKIKREARPTASLFEPAFEPWTGGFPTYSAYTHPFYTYGGGVFYSYPTAPQHQAAPSEHRSPQQQRESSPEVEEVFPNRTGSSSDADESTDAEQITPERAAFIAEARRKLAELERDKPLWEEAARKRRQQEEREAEEKHRRDQERRRAERLAQEEARRNAQRWEHFQKQQKMRKEHERQEQERRAREQARTQESYEHFKNTYTRSHAYWAYGSSGGSGYYPPPPNSHWHSHTHTKPRGTSTSAWTPSMALDRYNKQCTTFDSTKFSEESKLAQDAIPWPVLARPPVSVQLVDWDTVGEFFKTVRGSMSTADFAALVDKSHKRWHPDRWRSRTGAFRFIAGTQEQREEIEKKVNMVSQVLTPLWQETR